MTLQDSELFKSRYHYSIKHYSRDRNRVQVILPDAAIDKRTFELTNHIVPPSSCCAINKHSVQRNESAFTDQSSRHARVAFSQALDCTHGYNNQGSYMICRHVHRG